MKLLSLLLLATTSTFGQSTTVTGTVVDANGNAYFPGTVSAALYYANGIGPTSPPSVNPSSGPFATTSGGNFSITLTPNASITPANTQWVFTLCGTSILTYTGGPPQRQVCFMTAPITISGASQNITGSLGTISLLGPNNNVGGGTAFLGPNPWYDVTNPAYGAVADSKVGYNCSIVSGSTTLTCADITFVSGDAGKTIFVYGADSRANYVSLAGSGGSGSGTITIASFTNASTVTLSTAATATAQSTWVQVIGSTDNAPKIQAAINAACANSSTNSENPSAVYIPNTGGAYGIASRLNINCGNIKFFSNGHAVIMHTSPTIGPGSGTVNDGFGGQVLAIDTPPTPTQITVSGVTSNATITAGTNTLSCSGCTFTSGMVGQPIYVQYAGNQGLPLWTVITVFTDSHDVTLRDNASTTLPLSPIGLAGAPIFINYQVLENIEISGLNFQNAGYRYQEGVTSVGLPLVWFGTANNPAKRSLKFYDNVLMSDTNGGTANNGPFDGPIIANNKFYGGTDAAIYMSGQVSNSLVQGNYINHTDFPWSLPTLDSCMYMKPNVHGTTVNNVCTGSFAINGIAQIDFNSFDEMIMANRVNMTGAGTVCIQSNISTRLRVFDNECENGDIYIYRNTVIGATVRGNKIVNGRLRMDDNGSTGHGPSNVVVENNDMTPTANLPISFQKMEGVNYFSRNRVIFGSQNTNAPFSITTGLNGALNLLLPDNYAANLTGQVVLDWSTQNGQFEEEFWGTRPQVYGLVKQSTTGNQSVVPTAIADTTGAIGVVVKIEDTGAATGDALVEKYGRAWVIMDGATTLGDYVQISPTIGGAAHDTGARTTPASGMVVGTINHQTAQVGVLTTLNAGIVCNAASPIVCTVTTSGAAHGLTIREPFTITGTTFTLANFSGVVQTVPSTTTFTFCVGGGVDANLIPCNTTGIAASSTGNSGSINPPALVNLKFIDR